MTERLYYQDSYLREFEACVLEARTTERGKAVVLDSTAFYPTSGGQPHDQGWLGVARVLEVVEDDAGDILHYIEGELGNGPVHGIIEWQRRYDHMQQHSGQHLLSQTFVRLASAPTVSFHLGRETCTIDLEIGELSADLLARVEEEANQVVFENRALMVHFLDAEQVQNLDLRKEPARRGVLRVIEIDQYDRSACGGTHVRRTGELGLIVVTGAERYKSNYRIEYACGWRALRLFRQQHNILKSVTRQLSTGPDELPASFQKLINENKEQGRQIRDLTERLNEFEAELLFQTAEKRDGVWIVKAVLGTCPAENLKYLASKLLRKGPCLVLLASGGDSAFVVLGNSSPLGLDAGKVLGQTLQTFGGRGGGRADLAQGGGIPGSQAGKLLDALHGAIFNG